jgi:hypothetical protein
VISTVKTVKELKLRNLLGCTAVVLTEFRPTVKRLLLPPSSGYLWNVSWHSVKNTAVHPRRFWASYLPQWELGISRVKSYFTLIYYRRINTILNAVDCKYCKDAISKQVSQASCHSQSVVWWRHNTLKNIILKSRVQQGAFYYTYRVSTNDVSDLKYLFNRR